MSETSIQNTPIASPSASEVARASTTAPSRAPRRSPLGGLRQVLMAVASLRLTVFLLFLAIVLVFFGTMGQVDEGLFSVLSRYFRTWLAWIPWQALVRFGQVFFGFPKTWKATGSFPFPGGWLLGWMLLINLLAAHLVRFRLGWRRSGVLILHLGLILLMVGEFVTGHLSVESQMSIEKGEAVNFLDQTAHTELAITDHSDPKVDRVVAIPQTLLARMGTIRDDRLPFDVEVIEYAKNSKLIPVTEEAAKAPDMLVDATGARWQLSTKSEARGVDSDRDAPLVRVNFRRKDTGEVLDARVLSLWQYRNFTSRQLEFPPEEITVDEKPYEIELRNRRVYTPYKIQLNEFNHSKYEGTDIPKDYSSLVRLTDSERHEDREARIWMNHPLWYGHETFYQSGVMGDDKGTVLQVVRNPGWFLPYLSCVLVSLGMLIHFGLHLQRFLQKKVAN